MQNDYPADREVRPRKLAKSLSSNSESVILFPVKSGKSSGDDGIGYAKISRFGELLPDGIGKFISVPIPINIFWIAWLGYQFWHEDLDVVIASNIRAGLPAIIAGKLVGTPVVLDLQENNAEVAKLRAKDSLIQKLTRNHLVVGAVEDTCVSLADEIWVVVEERKSSLLDKGVLPQKISVVSNTPSLENSQNTNCGTSRDQFDWPGFTLLYVGHITEYRGLQDIIESLKIVHKEDKSITLAIAGDGPYKSELEALVKQLKLEDSVYFIGWMDPENIPHFLSSGDVGIIPHRINRFTNTTIPNKLFDYMAAGLPVFASAMDPVERVIAEYKCGITYDSDAGAEEISDLIIKMKNSDISSFSNTGREAINNTYNWSTEMETVRESLRRLSDKSPASNRG